MFDRKRGAPPGGDTTRPAPVRRHRALLARLVRILGTLARRTEHHLARNGGSPGWRWRESPAQMVDLLARTAAKLIPLERQAHDLNGSEPDHRADATLSDAERAHRIAAILEAARARRDRSADPDQEE
jgi:hypothetical protein